MGSSEPQTPAEKGFEGSKNVLGWDLEDFGRLGFCSSHSKSELISQPEFSLKTKAVTFATNILHSQMIFITFGALLQIVLMFKEIWTRSLEGSQ